MTISTRIQPTQAFTQGIKPRRVKIEESTGSLTLHADEVVMDNCTLIPEGIHGIVIHLSSKFHDGYNDFCTPPRDGKYIKLDGFYGESYLYGWYASVANPHNYGRSLNCSKQVIMNDFGVFAWLPV